MSEGAQVEARGRDKPASSSWLLLEAGEWTAQSATELLRRFEAGVLSAERSVKAGSLSEPKPLYRVMRELVWDAQAEASDPSARSHYFELVDHAPIPTAMSDLGGRITYVNRAFCDFIGYESEELIGMTVGAATGRPLSEEQITVRARPLSEAELTQYEADRELFVLEVHDRGVGIPPELIDRIIEPYVSTRHGQGGHGIGLSTVWSLCDQLGGTLKIESQLGLGTSMIMILPLSQLSQLSEAVPNPVNETERVDADRGREP